METINKPEERTNWSASADRVQNVLSLNKLIAKIDIETVDPFAPGKEKEELAIKLDGKYTPLQNQYILLRLEKDFFALPLSSALEVGRRPDITVLPNLPNWVLGISNVRGEIVSFINLKAFFGIPSTMTKTDRRFLIIQNHDMKVGIIVDRIMGILSLNQIDADLQKSPYREGEIANYILGVTVSGKRLTNILDIDKLLSSPRMTGFREN